MHHHRFLIAALIVAGLGCDALTAYSRRFEDEGRICLFPAGSAPENPFLLSLEPRAYRAGEALQIQVFIPGCQSGSCTHDARAECSATLEGTALQVKSRASFRHEGTDCSDDCVKMSAICATPPLPAGTYQIRHGAETLTIAIPGTVRPPCTAAEVAGP